MRESSSDTVSAKWMVTEAGLQYYRVYSAVVQMLMLAVAAIWSISSTNHKAFIALLFAMGLFHILYIWMPVVHARAKIADYYKGQLALTPDERERLAATCSEQQYVHDKSKREMVAAKYFHAVPGNIRRTIRTTRFKLDIVVPIGVAIVWSAMFASKLSA